MNDWLTRVRLPGELIMIVALGVLGWWLQGALSDLAVAKALADDRAEDQAQLQVQLRDASARTRADSLELEQVRDSLRIERVQAREMIVQAEQQETDASERAAQAGTDLDATHDSLYAVVRPELRPLVEIAQAQHREEQAAEQSVREAFREQLLGATALHQADSFAIVLLERNLATERAEKAILAESNRLYEEEIGFLRDALPSGFFGHVGSFMRGLGTGVAVVWVVR